MDINLSELQIMKDREAWHAAVHGVSRTWTSNGTAAAAKKKEEKEDFRNPS